jgi:hypothetical protein
MGAMGHSITDTSKQQSSNFATASRVDYDQSEVSFTGNFQDPVAGISKSQFQYCISSATFLFHQSLCIPQDSFSRLLPWSGVDWWERQSHNVNQGQSSTQQVGEIAGVPDGALHRFGTIYGN